MQWLQVELFSRSILLLIVLDFFVVSTHSSPYLAKLHLFQIHLLNALLPRDLLHLLILVLLSILIFRLLVILLSSAQHCA